MSALQSEGDTAPTIRRLVVTRGARQLPLPFPPYQVIARVCVYVRAPQARTHRAAHRTPEPQPEFVFRYVDPFLAGLPRTIADEEPRPKSQRYTEDEIHEMRALYRRGVPRPTICILYKISKQNLHCIIHKKTHKEFDF